jgi:hypothetical protein
MQLQLLDSIFCLQFCALIQIWATDCTDGLQAVFSNSEHRNIVVAGLRNVLDMMQTYDRSRSGRLSRAETDTLFRNLFPDHYSNYELVVGEYLPQVSSICNHTPLAQCPFDVASHH